MFSTIERAREELKLSRSVTHTAPSALPVVATERLDPAAAVRVLQLQVMHLQDAVDALVELAVKRGG